MRLRMIRGTLPGLPRISRTRTSSNCGSATSPLPCIGPRGKFYATQDLCTHEHAYLSDGVVVDCVVECPFHQGRFDIRDGKSAWSAGDRAARNLSDQDRRRPDLCSGHRTSRRGPMPGSRPQTGLDALTAEEGSPPVEHAGIKARTRTRPAPLSLDQQAAQGRLAAPVDVGDPPTLPQLDEVEHHGGRLVQVLE